MKGSQGITTDVNICFINYEMIKTHMIKTNYGIVWIKIAFIKWMHISCLIYHFLEAALFWDVFASFLFFLLIINRESHSVVFVSTNEKRLQNQVYRQIKSKPMDTLDLAKVYRLKGLTSLYIISCLHFLNLNNILTLPKTLVVTEAGFGLTRVMFALFFCLPDFKIKTNPSRLYDTNQKQKMAGHFWKKRLFIKTFHISFNQS